MTPPDPAILGRIEPYLLGRLSPHERNRLERLIFEDEGVWSAVRETEDDLIDRFLEGTLSAPDREDFERHFAAPPSRRQRIELARSLPAVLRAGAARPRPQRPRAVRPWVGLAATVALAALWLGRERLTTPVTSSGTLAPAPAPMAPPRGREGAPPVSSLPPAPALPAAPDLVLGGHVLRGGATAGIPRLMRPSPGATVHIEMALDAPAAAPFRTAATLRTVEGVVAWSGEADLHTEGRWARVRLPARVLPAGDYLLRVADTEHAFRVRAAPVERAR